MAENSSEGVWYSPDRIPPEGIYYDIKDGKEPPCIFAAGVILAGTMFAGWGGWALVSWLSR